MAALQKLNKEQITLPKLLLFGLYLFWSERLLWSLNFGIDRNLRTKDQVNLQSLSFLPVYLNTINKAIIPKASDLYQDHSHAPLPNLQQLPSWHYLMNKTQYSNNQNESRLLEIDQGSKKGTEGGPWDKATDGGLEASALST